MMYVAYRIYVCVNIRDQCHCIALSCHRLFVFQFYKHMNDIFYSVVFLLHFFGFMFMFIVLLLYA